jgi:hypothetical protein
MRAIVAVASCIGIGFVLQGCGGGQDGVCLADKMDVVSQTISGKLEASVDTTFNGTTVTTTQVASFVEMFDFEKFNIREDAFGDAKVTVDGKSRTVSTNTTQIVNVGEKQVISYSSVDIDGQVTKTCVIAELPPNFPTPATLATLWQLEVKPMVQRTAICGGNDGTYDTWKFSKSWDGPVPQIPDSPPMLDGLVIKDGSVSEDVEMTQDHLLHASTTSVSGELLNGTVVLGTTKSKFTLTVTDMKKGGPSAADLDPSQFDVNCTPASATVDPEVFLRSPGFARQQLRSILESSMKSGDALLV